jgi:hypothetical protein
MAARPLHHPAQVGLPDLRIYNSHPGASPGCVGGPPPPLRGGG